MKKKHHHAYHYHPKANPIAAAKPLTLSLCMIVKNEADHLGACLESIRPAVDEIIVVDTGSTDATKEIALSHGAKLFEFPWCGDFSAARNVSLEHATCDYILWLDADDRVKPEEIAKLKQFKYALPPLKNQAFFLTVRNQFIDNDIHFSQLRIFPNLPNARFEFRIHEQISGVLIAAGVSLLQTDIAIDHTGYHTSEAVNKKLLRNLEIVENELKVDPDNPFTRLQAGRTLEGLNRYAEAIVHMQKVVSTPDLKMTQQHLHWNATILLGRYHNFLAQYAEGEIVLRGLLQDFPKDDLIRFFLSESLIGAKKYLEASVVLKQFMERPLNVGVFPLNLSLVSFQRYYYLGVVSKEIGEQDLARKMFVKSLGIHTDDFKSRMSLGSLDLQQGRFAEAAEEYEQVIRLSPAPNAGNYANLGFAYRKLGRLSEAETALAKSLELFPRQIEALTQLGYLALDQKDYSKSKDYFLRAQEEDPSLTDVKLALALIFWRTQEIESVIQQCELLLRELSLPTGIQLEGFASLARLFETIGDRLSEHQRAEMAGLAFQLSWLIYPLPEVLEKLMAGPKSPRDMAILRESLEKHAGDTQIINSLKSALHHLSALAA
jgi:glycosyltransferase involved in cell wall biosynthesis